MVLESWLPIGYKLPSGNCTRRVVWEGLGWQIVDTINGGKSLLAMDFLVDKWVDAGLVTRDTFSRFFFGDLSIHSLDSSCGQALAPLDSSRAPQTKSEALSFAISFKKTREIDENTPLQDALYVEKLSRVLPTYTISSVAHDDMVFGYWLTGGQQISVKSQRRLEQAMSWLERSHLKDIVEAGGFGFAEQVDGLTTTEDKDSKPESEKDLPNNQQFELAGRPELAEFFNEHVVDIVKNKDRYKALGIDFPSAIILHGPPGCGKTFAVERLVEFLGWPSFQIDASSVASPYIHETSKKVAQVFEQAKANSPSVLVIDEMEAFLADRGNGAGSGHHRVEEVAEFLRRIPEAIRDEVLIVAMTNRIEMIDPAILRRGRFDHIITVDYANEQEVRGLINHLLQSLPTADDVDSELIAKELAGRPLSDVTFVIREGARLAAKAGRSSLDQASLLKALMSTPARDNQQKESNRIGFV